MDFRDLMPDDPLASIRTEWAREDRAKAERREYLAQPGKVMEDVATLAEHYSPSKKKVQSKSYTKFEALRRREEGGPLEGFQENLLGVYKQSLADNATVGLSKEEVLSSSAKVLMDTSPGEGLPTYREALYRNKWKADTSLGRMLGAFGPDESVKTPPSTTVLTPEGEEKELTYTKWREAEEARTAEETKSEWVTPSGVAFGAGLPLAISLGKNIARKGLMGLIPVPGARLAAVGSIAYDVAKTVPLLLGFDVGKNILRHSEWARARQEKGKLDRADIFEFGAGFAAMGLTGVGGKIAKRLISKSSKAVAALPRQIPYDRKQLSYDKRLLPPPPSDRLLPGTISVPPGGFPPPKGRGEWIPPTAPVMGDTAAIVLDKGRASTLADAVSDEIRGTFKINDYKLLESMLGERSLLETSKLPVSAKYIKPEFKPPVSLTSLDDMIKSNPWVYKAAPRTWFEREFSKMSADAREATLALCARHDWPLRKAVFTQRQTKEFAVAVQESKFAGRGDMSLLESTWKAKKGKVSEVTKRRKVQETRTKIAKKNVKKTFVKNQEKVASAESEYHGKIAGAMGKVPGAKGPAAEAESIVRDLIVAEGKYVGLDRKAMTEQIKADVGPVMDRLKGLLGTGGKARLDAEYLWTSVRDALESKAQPTARGVVQTWMKRRHPFVMGAAGVAALGMIPLEFQQATEEDIATRRVMELSEDTETGWTATQNLTLKGEDIVGKDGKLSDTFKSFGKDILEFGEVALSNFSEFIGPKEAEAATITTVSKAAIPMVKEAAAKGKKALTNLFSDMFESGHIHIPLAEGAKSVERPVDGFSTAEIIVDQVGTLKKALSGRTKSIIPRWLMSPFGRAQVLYKSRAVKNPDGTFKTEFFSPEPELASRQNARIHNIRDHLEVVSNILHDAGIPKKRTRPILKEMDELAKRFREDEIAYSALKMREEVLGKKLNSAIKGIDKAYARKGKSKTKLKEALDAKAKILESQELTRDALAKVSPGHEAFREAWRTKVMDLAKREPSTRIALMVEDAHIHEGLRELPGLLSYKEKEAVVFLKNMMQQYAKRFEEVGEKVIKERAYIHHAWHPSWTKKAAEDKLDSLGIKNDVVPFSRLFRRSKYSVQMSPDVNYIMQRYVFDAERRLQMLKFWDKRKLFSKESWWTHYHWVKQFGDDEVVKYWDSLMDRFKPPPENKLTTLANMYSSIEVLRLIAFSPSTAFKHIFKNIGTMSSLGIKEFASHIPEATHTAVKLLAHNAAYKVGPAMGLKVPAQLKKFEDQVAQSLLGTSRGINVFAGLDLEPSLRGIPGFWPAFERKLMAVNKAGGSLIGTVEAVDRAHTFRAAMGLAAKKGYTAKQALYAYWSQILEMNFLSAEMNPSWVRNPVTRALALFQNTAYKIFERRILTAENAGRDLMLVGKKIRAGNLPDTLTNLRAVGKWMAGAELKLKKDLIVENLTTTTDIFGVPYVQRAMRELLLSGIVLGGGSAIGLNLFPQVMHVPFLAHGAKEPTLAANPIVHAFFRTQLGKEQGGRPKEEEEFFMSAFLKEWLRGSGYMNMTANKLMRAHKSEIPTIYEADTGSIFPAELLYLFSVPRKKEAL